jgi:hypothetical protein
MRADAWREHVINCVREAERGDPRMLDRLALLLEQQDTATNRLRQKGYGWMGLPLIDMVEMAPAAAVWDRGAVVDEAVAARLTATGE